MPTTVMTATAMRGGTTGRWGGERTALTVGGSAAAVDGEDVEVQAESQVGMTAGGWQEWEVAGRSLCR